MSAINSFLLENQLRISNNPCISPDFCLDWASLQANIASNASIKAYQASSFTTDAGLWSLIEDANGDHAWCLLPSEGDGLGHLTEGVVIDGKTYFPASFENLIKVKNLVQESACECTISEWNERLILIHKRSQLLQDKHWNR